ncbi:hypothetical protein CVT24_004436 [Panaeolus cyanescens]|uniref:F-box domain-containing protein n=1 Tax=Panaeolus cyanescens TaxID=181874 RepID=A0A409VA25_9AGAR|nr:hypothetical protein CVT24_004436 [Panaeolus cyanescens]
MPSQAKPLPELPLELWTEIISYLPRGTFQKLIGLNRHLLELVLDDKYETFHYTSNENHVVPRIHEFEGFRIAQRIRHLMISPAAILKTVSGSSVAEQLDLSAQWNALASCVNIERVTIDLFDLEIPSAFLNLLTSLWQMTGCRLTMIALKVPVTRLKPILDTLTKEACSIPKLNHLDLTFSATHKPPLSSKIDEAIQSLNLFLTAFSRTLTELTICSRLKLDLDGLFGKLVTLPNLKVLNLWSHLDDRHTFPSVEGFTNYIVKHSHHLESLRIDPNPRVAESLVYQDGMLAQGFHTPFYSLEKQAQFALVKFPKLRALQTVLRHPNLSPLGPVTCMGPYSCLLPGFSSTLNLTTLKILSYPLVYEAVATLLSQLGEGGDKPSGLKNLRLNVVALSPELFELFVQHLPHLESYADVHTERIPRFVEREEVYADAIAKPAFDGFVKMLV